MFLQKNLNFWIVPIRNYVFTVGTQLVSVLEEKSLLPKKCVGVFSPYNTQLQFLPMHWSNVWYQCDQAMPQVMLVMAPKSVRPVYIMANRFSIFLLSMFRSYLQHKTKLHFLCFIVSNFVHFSCKCRNNKKHLLSRLTFLHKYLWDLYVTYSGMQNFY